MDEAAEAKVECVAALSDVQSLLGIARELNQHPDLTQYDYGYRIGVWFAINHLLDARTARDYALHPPPPPVGLPCRCRHYLASHATYFENGVATEFTNCFCGCTKFEPRE